MNVKDFYAHISGDYKEALARLMNDVLIEKFIRKFKETQSLDNLEKAIKEHNYQQAFFEVHTLKGVSLNLAFTKLGEAASELTELLRGDLYKTADEKTVNELYNKIEDAYLEIIANIGSN